MTSKTRLERALETHASAGLKASSTRDISGASAGRRFLPDGVRFPLEPIDERLFAGVVRLHYAVKNGSQARSHVDDSAEPRRP